MKRSEYREYSFRGRCHIISANKIKLFITRFNYNNEYNFTKYIAENFTIFTMFPSQVCYYKEYIEYQFS